MGRLAVPPDATRDAGLWLTSLDDCRINQVDRTRFWVEAEKVFVRGDQDRIGGDRRRCDP